MASTAFIQQGAEAAVSQHEGEDLVLEVVDEHGTVDDGGRKDLGYNDADGQDRGELLRDVLVVEPILLSRERVEEEEVRGSHAEQYCEKKRERHLLPKRGTEDKVSDSSERVRYHLCLRFKHEDRLAGSIGLEAHSVVDATLSNTDAVQ